MQNFGFLQKKRIIENTEKTPETLRFSGVFLVPYYTIPKIKRELKRKRGARVTMNNYTIPKIKRELKLVKSRVSVPTNYTIPKIKRELKLIVISLRLLSYYTIPKIKRELKRKC